MSNFHINDFKRRTNYRLAHINAKALQLPFCRASSGEPTLPQKVSNSVNAFHQKR